jgi:hypothetical protein
VRRRKGISYANRSATARGLITSTAQLLLAIRPRRQQRQVSIGRLHSRRPKARTHRTPLAVTNPRVYNRSHPILPYRPIREPMGTPVLAVAQYALVVICLCPQWNVVSFLGHRERAGTRHAWFAEAREEKILLHSRSRRCGWLEEEDSTKEKMINRDAERS